MHTSLQLCLKNITQELVQLDHHEKRTKSEKITKKKKNSIPYLELEILEAAPNNVDNLQHFHMQVKNKQMTTYFHWPKLSACRTTHFE